MFETAWAKTFFFTGSASIASFITYVGIKHEVLYIFITLLTIDYITGLMKASAIGENISSHRMKYGVASKASMIFIPISLGLGAKAIDQDVSLVFLWGFNLLIVSEVYSILGNVNAIRTGVELPEIDVISKIAKRIMKAMGG